MHRVGINKGDAQGRAGFPPPFHPSPPRGGCCTGIISTCNAPLPLARRLLSLAACGGFSAGSFV